MSLMSKLLLYVLTDIDWIEDYISFMKSDTSCKKKKK